MWKDHQINTTDLTEEIYAAIKNFFIGETECLVDQIKVCFYNGQKFLLTVTEVE